VIAERTLARDRLQGVRLVPLFRPQEGDVRIAVDDVRALLAEELHDQGRRLTKSATPPPGVATGENTQ
jgi:hypothetical protein